MNRISKSKGLSKEVRKLISWAEANGWHVARRTGTGHLLLRHQSGVSVTMSATPSDSRSLNNARADMEREMRKSVGW